MKITATKITLTFDDMLEISRKYNRSDPRAFRKSEPTEYMIGVWLGWFFANNPDLAPYIAEIVEVEIDRPPGWSPGDIIPGAADHLPGMSIEIEHDDRSHRLTSNSEGLITLPGILVRRSTLGSALVAAINAIRIKRGGR